MQKNMAFMKKAKDLEKRKRTKTYDGNDFEFRSHHGHLVEFLVKTLCGNLSCLLVTQLAGKALRQHLNLGSNAQHILG